jgi:polar amino acid transport system permease protein
MESIMIDIALIYDSIPALAQGTLLSLQITLVATLIGLSFGTTLAYGQMCAPRAIKGAIFSYITFIRGTPMLVQILFLYYTLPQCGIQIDPFWAASIAIGCNSSAYVSQIIASGIRAVPTGQIEAAQVLGFTSRDTMRYIVLPQAFRNALPTLGNEQITLIKDSSLASIIGVMELSKEASIIRSQTYDVFSVLLAVSAIYLLMTTTVSLIVKKMERKAHVRS